MHSPVSIFTHSYATTSKRTFPTEGWQFSTPEEQGIQSQKLARMMEHIKNKSYDIDSILIVRNGYMVLDSYFWPFSKKQKHNIYSCTKSVMSALIGIAIEKGYIQNVNQPITEFFPDKTFDNMDDLKKSITLEDLLMMASGLKCRDSYLYRWKGLFEMRNSPDWAQYVLDLPMVDAPGEKFEYCNGVSYLLSVILQNTTKMKTLEYARKHLFDPLGIIDVYWDQSPQGFDIGYGRMWLKPHDMARFGWLYLNKGRWGNQQILPSEWVEASTRGHIDATLFGYYGYQWWVDSAGYYMAVGYKGQRIFVVPEKNMVAVFTGDLSGKESLISKKLLDLFIIPAAASSEPLSSNPVETARLDELQNDISKDRTRDFIWMSKKDGIAKDGTFERAASPSFKFEYPLGSKKAATEFSGQIMRMKTPGNTEFSVSLGDIPGNIKLEDFGPNFYAPMLKNVGSNIKVISNKEIVLTCGTKAYRTDITWLWKNSLSVTTYLVSVYKGDKYIFLDAHPTMGHYQVELIIQSLRFK